ncbi:MAG: hypothetical protein JSU85_04225 [Candidatus Zixiibacteriota bacterium]|nr:MAG: hypothetical protein JSU85_04225 [candidate division Zixibacteria bacterium]
MMKKLVLIVGAGATVADVMGRSKRKRPPLDKNFFSMSRVSHPLITRQISKYINDKYGINIFDPQNDSLERAMAIIYTDMYNPTIEGEATRAFHRLIALFNRRLADTTNNLPPNKRRYQ